MFANLWLKIIAHDATTDFGSWAFGALVGLLGGKKLAGELTT